MHLAISVMSAVQRKYAYDYSAITAAQTNGHDGIDDLTLSTKRPSFDRTDANRPCAASSVLLCTAYKHGQDSELKVLKANVRLIQRQFTDYEYLRYGRMLSQAYIDRTQREVGLTVPDVIVALCVSFSFASRDYALFDLSRRLSLALKLWTAKKPYISKKMLFALIGHLRLRMHHNSSQTKTEKMSNEQIEQCYHELIQMQCIVVIEPHNNNGDGLLAVSESPSDSECVLNYFRFVL